MPWTAWRSGRNQILRLDTARRKRFSTNALRWAGGITANGALP